LVNTWLMLLFLNVEFWKQVPPSEPYRVVLSDVRDKLYNTRERARHLLATGFSEIPEEATFTDVEQVSQVKQWCPILID
jgi:phosphoenolpyruvate carboxylase